MDIYPPTKQRPRLLELLDVIGAAPRSLRRDECSDWAIFGKYGHIFAVPIKAAPTGEGFQLVIIPPEGHPQKWAYAKQRLPFCRVTQNGDGEGCMMIDHMPTPEEGELIRDVMGIPKAFVFSPEVLERKRAQGQRLAAERKAATVADDKLAEATTP